MLIIYGYRPAILKKNSPRLLPFYMAVPTYCYYEKMRRTMGTAIVWYLLNWNKYQSKETIYSDKTNIKIP